MTRSFPGEGSKTHTPSRPQTRPSLRTRLVGAKRDVQRATGMSSVRFSPT